MKKEIINSIYGIYQSHINQDPEFDRIDNISTEGDKLLDELMIESAREEVHKLLYNAVYVDTDGVYC